MLSKVRIQVLLKPRAQDLSSVARSPLTLPIKPVEVLMKTHRFVVHECFTGTNRANRSLRGVLCWISGIINISFVHLRVYCIYLLELVLSAA